MRSVKAVYENGSLLFPEGNGPEGRMEVVVVFPDQGEPAAPRDKDAGKRFVREWSGVLKGCDISNWKDQKADYLKGKSSEIFRPGRGEQKSREQNNCPHEV